MAEVVDRPIEERLRYGSDLHNRIATRLRQRRKLSEREITRRYDDWNRVDEHLQLYVDLTRGARRGDRTTDYSAKEMPFQRSIVVPVSYAILQVRLTAIMAIYMARQPMIQLTGRGPEDMAAARLMEMVLAYDLQETAAFLALYAGFQSAEKYGLGILADSWEEDYGWVTTRMGDIQGYAPGEIEQLARLAGVQTTQRVWGLQREYAAIRAVDPYSFWPDPRVPGMNVQEMEFCGDRVFRGLTHLETRSMQNGGVYFNLEAARKSSRRGGEGMRGLNTGRQMINRYNLGDTADELDRGSFAIDQLEIKLIPREWGLSGERRPEKWRFSILEDDVIIRAHRMPFQHDQFTYAVMQPNYDAFSSFTNGVIEDLDGLQRVTNWLFNSHFENVRRFLNDTFVYDPTLIEEDDLFNPGPARHIRLTEEASRLIKNGMLQPQNVLHQLPLSDVTRGHLQEMDNIFDMAQRMSGVNDPAMGQPLPGRRTLGEVENIVFSSSRRMTLSAQLYDLQAITPLAKRMVSNRQQFMTEAAFFNIVGEQADPRAPQQVFINRELILGNYNYVPLAGVTPPDPARFSETWIQLLQVMAQLPPEILMGFDIGAFVSEVAKGMGVMHLDRFRVQAAPDAAVSRGVEAGNLAPVGAAPASGPASPAPVGA